MPISRASMEDWRCARCGEASSRPTWLAVDAVERPDLLDRFSDLIEFECSACSEPVRRSQPLLVLRLAKAAPLIVARDADDERDALDTLEETVSDVQHELGDALDDVPGPPVIVSLDEIVAGIRGNVDADFEAFHSGVDGLSAQEPAYRSLLSKVAVSQRWQQIDGGLKALALVGSEEELRDVVEHWPEILSAEAEHRAAQRVEAAATDSERDFAASILKTVRLVRQGDFSGAWSLRESVIREYLEDLKETTAPRLRALQAAWSDARWPEVVRIGRELLAVLPPATRPEMQVDLAHFTATALLHLEGSDRGEGAEEAIGLCRFALSTLDVSPDIDTPQRRIPIVSNLGSAFGFRLRGDPAWNGEQAIAYLTDAIELSWDAGDWDSWAMAQTNLANALINRGQAGDYDQARDHLRLALTYRSRQRNARDWAFTELHLGLSYSRDDSGDRAANLQDAVLHFSKARDAARVAEDIPLLAYSEHNLAVERLELARMPGTAPDLRSELLDRAEANARESARLSSADSSPVRFGHAWKMVGEACAARADRDGAIEAFKTALSVLSADVAPSAARKASRVLMDAAEAQGDVELAGEAAARLVEAAEATISARSRTDHRMSEHRGPQTTDFRFAANALVRADRIEEAVSALELGRTTELGLLTLDESIDLDMLAYLDPRLRDELEQVSASFRADILELEERSVSDRSEQFARIRAALQQIPTFEGALDPPTLQEIGEIAQQQRPLVYLGSAPTGSFAIIIGRDECEGLQIEAMHVADCDSRAISHLAIGFDADGAEVAPNPYLVAQAFEPEMLDTAIAALSPLVGQKLLRPLSESLARRGASGVTLVAAGLLRIMPLHAIPWTDATGRTLTLLDDFDVTFAPSARLQRACIRRASGRAVDPIHLLGIANPLPHPRPLDGAELEMELVQRFVPTDNIRVLRGEEATKERVVEVLPLGTHLHLACHGGGRVFDPLFSAALSLSNEEELSALEIARLDIPARLVVASGCETGVPQGGYYAVDESLDLASAFIAAGAAGVVSTLWSVEDFPTALIISKFYEGLFVANIPPAAALRRAQTWMRDADESAIEAYASARAPLRELRSRSKPSVVSSGAAPFSAPSCWAGFVFSGA